MFCIETLDHVGLIVRDIAKSAAWYREVLGLTRVDQDRWDGVPTIMAVENGTGVALFPLEDSSAPPMNPSRRIVAVHHFAFRVSQTAFTQAQAHFERISVPFEFQDHDIFHSIYLQDPDGYRVELMTEV